MTYDELKAAVLGLSPEQQTRFVTELVPLLWPTACLDDACVQSFRALVDEATVKKYKEEHMGSI
jgi:hypothetical protein